MVYWKYENLLFVVLLCVRNRVRIPSDSWLPMQAWVQTLQNFQSGPWFWSSEQAYLALAELHIFYWEQNSRVPWSTGVDAQIDANQATSRKGSQTSLNKVGSCLQQQAAKRSKAFTSLWLTSPVPELRTASRETKTSSLSCHGDYDKSSDVKHHYFEELFLTPEIAAATDSGPSFRTSCHSQASSSAPNSCIPTSPLPSHFYTAVVWPLSFFFRWQNWVLLAAYTAEKL